jgi:hypothetical protein
MSDTLGFIPRYLQRKLHTYPKVSDIIYRESYTLIPRYLTLSTEKAKIPWDKCVAFSVDNVRYLGISV